MNIGPVNYTLAIGGGLAGGSIAGMALSDKPTARKVFMGTVVGGTVAAGIAGIAGTVGGFAANGGAYAAQNGRNLTALQQWATKGGISGLPKGYQPLLFSAAVGVGMLGATMAANMVLDVNDRSLSGGQ